MVSYCILRDLTYSRIPIKTDEKRKFMDESHKSKGLSEFEAEK